MRRKTRFGAAILRRLCIGICIAGALLASQQTVQAQQNQVRTLALFSPGSENNAFWSQIIAFTKAACFDLNMKLDVYYGNDDPKILMRHMETVAKSVPKPDALLFPAMKDAGEACLKIAESNQIPAFVFNMGLDESVVGAPRTKYKYFIGQMVPDDEVAGYELALALLQAAKTAKQTNFGVIAVSGRTTDAAAIMRNKGLMRAVGAFPGASTPGVISTDWTRSEAVDQAKKAITKNPGHSIVWAASDNMALGITESAPIWGFKPGVDFFAGGVDWTPEAIQAVIDKKLVATAGGHFMEGGWAAVLLYDYFNGRDFATEGVSVKSPMGLINSENAKLYQSKLGDGNWGRINFNMFSKVGNKNLKTYNFQISTVLMVLRN